MKTLSSPILLLAATALCALARSIPDNVQQFYDYHIKGNCSNPLSNAFTDGLSNARNMFYCQDPITGVVYLKGPPGEYADLDIDCDGANHLAGRCSNDPTGQPLTAFMDTVASYRQGVKNLDAHIHPYVVFGNEGDKPAWDPRDVGIKPLSVIAVVCNGALYYGIWGDTNGGIDTGEAALSMGQLCFGDNAVSGNSGHETHDVLYIAFPGKEAVPGATGAKWNATTKEEFEQSITALGDKLVANLTVVEQYTGFGVSSRLMNEWLLVVMTLVMWAGFWLNI